LTAKGKGGLIYWKDRGVAAPHAALPFNRLKGRAKRAPQLPPPACGGFPALRRGFGDRQKLAALRQFAGLIPKPPLRSGGGNRGMKVNSKKKKKQKKTQTENARIRGQGQAYPTALTSGGCATELCCCASSKVFPSNTNPR